MITSLCGEIADPTLGAVLADVPSEHELQSLCVQIPAAMKRLDRTDEAGMAVLQKEFSRFLEGDSDIYREVHVLMLEGV